MKVNKLLRVKACLQDQIRGFGQAVVYCNPKI
jgi:hypothetical protein